MDILEGLIWPGEQGPNEFSEHEMLTCKILLSVSYLLFGLIRPLVTPLAHFPTMESFDLTVFINKCDKVYYI